jgi:hypothetical protein
MMTRVRAKLHAATGHARGWVEIGTESFALVPAGRASVVLPPGFETDSANLRIRVNWFGLVGIEVEGPNETTWFAIVWPWRWATLRRALDDAQINYRVERTAVRVGATLLATRG